MGRPRQGRRKQSLRRTLMPPAEPAKYTMLSQFRISDREFCDLRDFIQQASGIHIANNRKYLLQNRLSPRLRELGLDTFSEYFKRLQGPDRVCERAKLFELVTTNETSFFRNPPQLDYFRDTLLSAMIESQRSKNAKNLHIWSAGCSSGEEPYTLAILLAETLKAELPSWRLKITASDLSEAVLALAREGAYDDYALRTTPAPIKAKYFAKDADGFRIRPEVKKQVRFVSLNLNDSAALKRVETSHFIFCRNVMIYFDEDMKKRLARAFYENLTPGGHLLIGHSETLTGVNESFIQARHPGAVAYLKK
jgi:chemotaxis protein methyltransferase CheR